ncbi:ATP-binding protein [Chloroflexi bacterium TSY]|nr:ATP-binding protein [Chloroflexi bacterium TSY]
MISSPDFRAGSNPEQGDLSTLNLHKEQKFENFNLNRSDLNAQERTGLKKIVQVAKDFADEPEGWLVLTGDYGCGKTHLAAAIANHQFARSLGSATFVVVPDLLDHLRATFSPMSNTPYDRRFDEIRKAPLLILDDLGTESATPWAKEKLFQILNYRYNAKLPSVITIAEREFDTLERRLLTRIMDVEHCQVCQISAPSYRGSQSQQKSQRKKTASL